MPLKRGELIISMKAFCVFFILCSLSLATAGAATEQEIVNQSASILRDFRRMPEKGIPGNVLRNAKGLAILTVVKVGLGISGKGGQGVVIARTDRGWSGPSFVGTGGAGWGPQIGAQVTDFVFVLNTNRAVRAFSRDGNVTLGCRRERRRGTGGTRCTRGSDTDGRHLHLQPKQRPVRGCLARRSGDRHPKNGQRPVLRPARHGG